MSTLPRVPRVGPIKYVRPENGSPYIWHAKIKNFDLIIGLGRHGSGWSAEPICKPSYITNMTNPNWGDPMSGKTRDEACHSLIASAYIDDSKTEYVYVVSEYFPTPGPRRVLVKPVAAFDTLSAAMGHVEGLALEHARKSGDSYERPIWSESKDFWDDGVAATIARVKYK